MSLGMSDELLAGIVPVALYWLYSGMYVVLGPYLEQYRIHTKEEEETKNLVTKSDVVKGALMEHALQILFVVLTAKLKSGGGDASPPQPPLPVIAGQFLTAMLVFDAWMYFTHRLLHANAFLYKHIHSKHHKQHVTYPYGAQYNHPVEGFLSEILGAVLAFLASGMTPRTSIFYYSFAAVKGVEDHCGYYMPWNPFHRLFQANSVFHDIHHQLYGQKSNFSVPFFCFWDKALGTHRGYELVKRVDGRGYEVKPTLK